jgi:hypothetical protein
MAQTGPASFFEPSLAYEPGTTGTAACTVSEPVAGVASFAGNCSSGLLVTYEVPLAAWLAHDNEVVDTGDAGV